MITRRGFLGAAGASVLLSDPALARRLSSDGAAEPWYGSGSGDPRFFSVARSGGAGVGSGGFNPAYQPQVVGYGGPEAPGTLVVSTADRFLYLVQGGGKAIRYGIGVGRHGFAWSGTAKVGRKAEWPSWRPPAEMMQRRPDLPSFMPGGPGNPLGARALYLWQGNKDTLYRIHGTLEPWTIGQSVSSGCIRMINQDVIDLYNHTPVGTKVVVLDATSSNHERHKAAVFGPSSRGSEGELISRVHQERL